MKSENDGTGITYAVMPIDILQDKNLTPSEKILYCYLGVFRKGVCFQSNEKLAEMTGFDESTIKRGIKKLAELKYIFVEFVNNNSAMRRIYVVLDNPKKLAYLSKKGAFNEDSVATTAMSEPEPTEEPEAEPILDTTSMKIRPNSRPMRKNYESDEQYEEAFYKWNSLRYNEVV